MTQPRIATSEEVHDFSQPHPGKDAIDWSPYADGQWWLIYEGSPGDPVADHLRAFGRIKAGSRRWADRRGYIRETRRRENGRRVWVRFMKDLARGSGCGS
jgi:hypothetical protein